MTSITDPCTDHNATLGQNKLMNGNASMTNGASTVSDIDLDVLVVGGGFAGIYQLKKFRSLGHKVLLVDSGSSYGGTWYWNRYPGARVDTSAPQYQFSDPDIWQNFNFSQRFPGSEEIRAYFEFVADKWDIRKDTRFNTYVQSAVWDEQTGKWVVTARDGSKYRAKYLSLCLGCLTDKYIPEWEGKEEYKGFLIHPASWLHTKPDLTGKNVAIIGTGATGVQITQELSNVVNQLTVFQRTPNTALPMRQINYGEANKSLSHEEVRASLAARKASFAGFDYNFIQRETNDDDAEKRRQTYEKLWDEGDFKYWLATYRDMLFDEAANFECYNFWREKTRPRIKDPKTADILVPATPPYAFGTKRIPLEQNYYEAFNLPNVHLVDLRATPITRLTPTGIQTTTKHHAFDAIVSATGFDALTGALTRIDIVGRDGLLLRDHWSNHVKTHLGLSAHGFPNLFFAYGPQAPSVFCNGPACAELQGDWITATISHCLTNRVGTMEATAEAEVEWRQEVFDLANKSLLTGTRSWYMGDEIPGKTREPLLYLGGVPSYLERLDEVREKGWEGFVLEGARSEVEMP